MARSGCNCRSTCGCRLQVTDTTTIDHTLGGSGNIASPWDISSEVILTPDADVPNPNGLDPSANLINRGDADGSTGIYVSCEDVQDCVGQGMDAGLEYVDDQNLFRVRLTPDDEVPNDSATDPLQNLVKFADDGSLYVSCDDVLDCIPPDEPAALGCGLELDGAGATAVASNPWPYACDPQTDGGVVACGDDGRLYSEPSTYGAAEASQRGPTGATDTCAFPDAVGVFNELEATPAALVVNNPDPCRPMTVSVQVNGRLRLNVNSDHPGKDGDPAAPLFYAAQGRFRVTDNFGNDVVTERAQYGYTNQPGDTQGSQINNVSVNWPDRDQFPSVVIPAGGNLTLNTFVEYEQSGADTADFCSRFLWNSPGLAVTGYSHI